MTLVSLALVARPAQLGAVGVRVYVLGLSALPANSRILLAPDELEELYRMNAGAVRLPAKSAARIGRRVGRVKRGIAAVD